MGRDLTAEAEKAVLWVDMEMAPTLRRLRRLDSFESVGAKITGAIVIG
jgi:hypothetical protein